MREFQKINALRLGLLCCAGLFPTAAFAQEGQEGEDLIVVTATPIRDSQEAAIEAKRNSINIVEIISADTAGRFPDQNLADSLGRVPGLAIERDQGQARFINFRGAPFRFTSIAFDGIDVPGAENGRVPRFDAFPSAIIDSVVVNKAITADMPGEAVAGYIDIKTADPLDRDGLFVSAEGGLGWQELGDVGTEKINGKVGYGGETFGVLLFGSHNKRGRITDNREYELAVDPATGEIIPENLDFRSYRGSREDNAYGGMIAARPSDGARIYLRSIYSEFIDDEERNQYDFELADGAAASMTELTPVAGYQADVPISRLLESGRYSNSTWVSTLGAEFGTDAWDITASVSYIETRNDFLLPIISSGGASAAASYDVGDIYNPVLNLFSPGTMDAIGVSDIGFTSNSILLFSGMLDTENWKFKLDLRRELPLLGEEGWIRFGGQVDLRDATGGDGLTVPGFPATVDIEDFRTGKPWSSDFLNSIGGVNYDNVGLRDALDQAIGPIVTIFPDDSILGIEENIYAGYVSVGSTYDWGSFVIGARLEATDFSTDGLLVNAEGGVDPIQRSNDYAFVLPNAHVNIDLADRLKFRLSGSSGISRPTYSEARASFSIDPTDSPPTITGGNPDLDAEFSWGFDASLEYYFAPASLLSAGAFVRFIDDVLYSAATTIEDGSQIAPELIPAGTPVAYNSTFNGEDGKLMGLEFNFIGQASFLPEPLDGFGVTANLTLLDSEFTAPILGGEEFPLPGTSDVIFNGSVFFERYGLSARLNYQYRDDWLSTTENETLSEFWDATTRVDASVRYLLPFTPGGVAVTLFADANNITDERDTRYSDTPATPNQYEGFGERYMFGLRLDY